ncbi:DNA repair protein RecO [Pedobacter sp. SYSU D00535]|uniref:DNA repair protein RecO n=1 Tax=Pedobacter sp. SYSU D00535 TaxID=2810308 RepID=UPI001A960E16|nr:DNA repair protein RecO [Pedobacter sp. SYSU D00535]
MLEKTRGIVLKVTDYSESSVVVQVFTEKFGLQSYLINGVKKAKAKIRLNMLQPLHLLHMVVYHKPNGNIQRVSELRNEPVFQEIPYNIIKSSLVLFLNEVLYRSIRHHYDDERLFEYLFNAIEFLDRTESGLANFHLYFLVQLTKYLGFYPDRSYEETSEFFDLKDGVFSNLHPPHSFILSGSQAKHFADLLATRFEVLDKLKMPPRERKHLLEKILMYFQLHIEGFPEIKSHLILEEILS